MPRPIITAALTGPVATKADNPGMPGNVAEMPPTPRRASRPGRRIHIHLRDDQGNMTADLDVAKRTVEAVREVRPGTTQLFTGGLQFTYEQRMALVEARPAMATLNPCTMTFGAAESRNFPRQMMELAARMIELGVKPEIQIYDTGHLDMMLYRLHKELLVEPLQVSFVMGVRGACAAIRRSVLARQGTARRHQPAGHRRGQRQPADDHHRPGHGGTHVRAWRTPSRSARMCRPNPTCSWSSASWGSPGRCSWSRPPAPEVIERLQLHPELVNGS